MALQESLENYSFLVEQANDGIVVVRDGQIKFVNTALTMLTGYTVKELQESNFIDYIEESELEKVKLNYAKRMKHIPGCYDQYPVLSCYYSWCKI